MDYVSDTAWQLSDVCMMTFWQQLPDYCLTTDTLLSDDCHAYDWQRKDFHNFKNDFAQKIYDNNDKFTVLCYNLLLCLLTNFLKLELGT